MYDNSILNIGADAYRDDSIIKKELLTYTPYTNSLAESEEIRINIHKHDSCLLPSESYLYMQLKVKTTNDDTTTADKIKFVENFPSYLFTDARYELDGIIVDRIKNVGITSTMKLKTAAAQSNTNGYYNFCKTFKGKQAQNAIETIYDVMLPLSIWFGFFDDYRKVILNSRHELILNRARNSLNCVYGGDTKATSPTVNITITKLEWKIPQITLSDETKLKMKNFLTKNKRIPVQYRSWDLYEYPDLPQTTDLQWNVKTVSNNPRYVLVAFQHEKNQSKTADASTFNSLQITSVRLHLNSNVYPYHMHDLDISNARYAELYEAYANIQSSYYNGVEPENRFSKGMADFQTDVIFAFDTSRSNESIKNASVDIRLGIKTAANIPAKTTAYCLIIYENEFVYSPFDGMVTKSE